MTDRLNLIETIAREDKFSMFARFMGTSGANALLSAGGDFTVLAPTNDAFGAIDDKTMHALILEPSQPKLKKLLSYHILPGKLMAANLASTQTRQSVTGEELSFSENNGLKINSASVQARNIEATNGVIHQIDTVLTPPTKPETAIANAATTTEFAAPRAEPHAELKTPDAIAAGLNRTSSIL
jgi:uncharacterized surface protein with fasciclin (FAS1) repeats